MIPDGFGKALPFILAGVFATLFLLEMAFPLRKRKRSIPGRLIINFIVAGSAYMAGAFIMKPVAFMIIGWTSESSFGLAHWAGLSPASRLIVSFLLMDLTFYYWHMANHEVGLLWRFHNVHHIDPDLDASTSFRFHFIEVLYSTAFRALQVSLIGISFFHYAIYELIFQGATMFHHSNMRLPVKIERIINYIFVTPRMHAIHHSIIHDETDSNYSVIFRWWDYIHRSLKLGVSQSDVTIGVAAYQRPEDNGLAHIFALPFLNQREYWKLDDGTVLESRTNENEINRNIMLE